ncbi:hypothetical protein NMY22_g15845 [Coprinellus aureogranulatus]|nr:hypothetical protein NMY22_g15845 [Coprinellus aureogranulatus]
MVSDEPSSLLLDLPRELLDEIVIKHATWSSQIRLRAVCRILNEATTHHALRTAVLQSEFRSRARALLNFGPCALDVHTTHLYLYPYARTSDELEELCVGILEKLRNVEILEFKVDEECPLTPRMVQALGQLPHLRDLTLLRLTTKHLKAPLIPPALVAPSELRRLTLEWHLKDESRDVLPVVKQARSFIAVCPNLEVVDIHRGCVQCVQRVNFSDLLQGAPMFRLPRGEFEPSLKTFTVRRSLKLSASCPLTMKYLANLTALTISNGQKEHQALWPAFLQREIYLTELSVYVASEPLLEYLLGYRGLKSFCGGQFEDLPKYANAEAPNEAVKDNQEISKRILCLGLYHHQKTLEKIWLIPCTNDHRWYTDPLGAEPWAMADEERLLCLKEFQSLKTLGLAILLDLDMSSVYFESTLRVVLSHLRTVEVLKLNTLPSPEVRKCVGTRRIRWFREADLDTISAILNFRFNSQEVYPRGRELILRIGYLDMEEGVWDNWWIERDELGDTHRFRNEESKDSCRINTHKTAVKHLEQQRQRREDAGTFAKKEYARYGGANLA